MLCDTMNIISASKSMLSEVNKLLRILLTIPVTTATAERALSTLVKTIKDIPAIKNDSTSAKQYDAVTYQRVR